MTGISDGNPNPIEWNLTLGVGGNSLIPGRERDTFGAACFYLGLSSEFKDLQIGREQTVWIPWLSRAGYLLCMVAVGLSKTR
jgi:hypothetical protein